MTTQGEKSSSCCCSSSSSSSVGHLGNFVHLMAEEHLFKEEVQLDGARGVTIKLNHGGLLQWSGKRNGSLIVPGDLIGFKQQESSVNLYSFPQLSSGNKKLCSRHCSSGANRVRKDILIKFTNPVSQKIFCDKIQQFLDISGMYVCNFMHGFHMGSITHWRERERGRGRGREFLFVCGFASV